MPDYFSNIASRNAENQSPDLAPLPISTAENATDFTELEIENEFKTENIPNEKANDIAKEKVRSENISQPKISNYFSSNLERNYFQISDITQIEQNHSKNIVENQLFENSEQHNEFKNVEKIENIFPSKNSKSEANQIIEKQQIFEKVISDKNSLELKPIATVNENNIFEQNSIFENNQQVSNNLLQPNLNTEISVENKNKTEATKLVIGKINVEILPVNQPITKVINRVVQAPAHTNFPKINRRSFGLGQL